MIITRFAVNPAYTFRQDWKYARSANRYVLLRNIQYTIECYCTGERANWDTVSALTLLGQLYIRVPGTDALTQFTPPDLDEGRTMSGYDRDPLREGSDYVEWPTAVYAWRVAERRVVTGEPGQDRKNTLYRITGRWKYSQGMFHSIQRSI